MKTNILQPGILLLLFLFCLPTLAQQPTLEWAKRYDGKISSGAEDEAVAVAVDAAGNSYVTGISQENGSQRIATVAYAPSGQQLWAVHYEEGSTPVDIAADNAGSVYVTGYNNGDYITIRYNTATGTQAWVRTFDGPGNGNDQATAIAVDYAGGVYVTGHSSGDYATIRYNAADGEQAWVQYYDGGNTDEATDIAVDNTGNVYVTGHSSGDYATVRYHAATGEQAWVQRYEGPGGSDRATAIAVDNAGGVYVTGSSTGDYYMNQHYATIRYETATGEQTWLHRGSDMVYSNDYATAIATDNTGGVYVTGYSYGIRGGAALYTIRHDATTGNPTWEQRYQRGEHHVAAAIAADNAGGVYVAGSTYNPDGVADYVTIRYEALTGDQNWAQLIGISEGSEDQARDLAVDANGGVYVTGHSIGSTLLQNYTTVRYTAATGEQSWVQQYNGGTSVSADDYTISLAVDAAGNSYVTGTSVREQSYTITTVKYSPSGEELWSVQHEDGSEAADIAVDNAGGVYVTGSRAGRMGNNYVTVRYDAETGEETWVSHYTGFGGPASAVAIAVDNAGGVYVTGSASSSSPIHTAYATIRYNAATGEETWARTYLSPGSGPSFATGIAVDNTGGVYVTGSSFDSRYGFSDYATVRYEAATGEETWVSRYTGFDSGNDRAAAIAVDNNGGVFVTGFSYDNANNIDYATVRYNAATGMEMWASRYNGPGNENDVATDIAVDNTGGVYVTGTSGGSTSSDYATVRYEAASGEETWVQRYQGSGSSFERAAAIAADNTGSVYVTGYSSADNNIVNTEYATVRYAAATGELIWAEHYAESGDNADVAVDIATDGMGNVIVTGYSYNLETGYDFLTVKYSQQGSECPDVADAAIVGSATVLAGTSAAEYFVSGTVPLYAVWTITDSEGNSYTNFTGQDSPTISVNWPSEPDFYKISVTYGTMEGCTLSTSPVYVHVFAPDAGFVTGGGWIISPANSEYEFMQSNSRAHWSLQARYSKGDENQVQGNTTLLLQAGAFTFRSTSYDAGSLVITDNRAYYSGRGTVTYREGPGRPVNDERQYGFLVAATDGDFGANTGPDRFRLKIWVINEDGSQGAVVYDSQAGCASTSLDDNAAACTTIGGGNITIHKPRARSVAQKNALSAGVTPGGQELMVYPTAASDRATVSFSLERAGDYSLELYDMKGALVKRIAAGSAEAGKRYEQEISVEKLGKGLYLARLTTGEKVQTVKLVVQR